MNRSAYQAALDWLDKHPGRVDHLHAEVRRLCALASTRLGHPVQPPRLTFDLRGRIAGTAGAHLIRLNPVLLRENFADMQRTTLAHEVAHSVVAQLWQNAAPHGRQWREVMMIFSVSAERCHSYDITTARIRRRLRYEFSCGCRRHFLGPVQRNRWGRDRTAYRCRRCNGALTDAGRSICLDADD